MMEIFLSAMLELLRRPALNFAATALLFHKIGLFAELNFAQIPILEKLGGCGTGAVSDQSAAFCVTYNLPLSFAA